MTTIVARRGRWSPLAGPLIACALVAGCAARSHLFEIELLIALREKELAWRQWNTESWGLRVRA